MRLSILSFGWFILLLAGCSGIDSVPLPDNNPEQEVIGDDVDVNTGGDTSEPDATDEGDEPAPINCEAGLSQCGTLCVDLDADVSNCGGCGRTCVIPNADASCVEGDCAILNCDDGFYDLDQELSNGCEVMDTCIEDVSCDTSCGSQGSIVCSDGSGTCAPPQELCNAVDDDCDGACEEALEGCRASIHRGYGIGGHFYSADLNRVSDSPYGLEVEGYFYLYNEAGPGMRPLFLCHKGNDRYLLSTETACEIGVAPEQTLGFIAPTAVCGAVPLYRLYKPEASNHFYTTRAAERDNAVASLGYLDEGIVGYVWKSP